MAAKRLSSFLSAPSICSSCRRLIPASKPALRPFSTSTPRGADDPRLVSSKDQAKIAPSPGNARVMANAAASPRPYGHAQSQQNLQNNWMDIALNEQMDRAATEIEQSLRLGEQPTHHLHVYATKHNTHITLTKPNRDAIISVACGNIGFRKAARGSYDAAYQLAAFVMNTIQERGLLRQIQNIELVLRGFGPGREAVTKVLLGQEGRNIRPKVSQVSDSTRLKFGGTRSKKPRRLG